MQVNRSNGNGHGSYGFDISADGRDDGQWNLGGEGHFRYDNGDHNYFHGEMYGGYGRDERGDNHGGWKGSVGFNRTF